MADFRAVYHLGWKEALALPGPEFLALASRLPFYPSVIRARAEQNEQQSRRNVRNPEARVVEVHDAAFAGILEIG